MPKDRPNNKRNKPSKVKVKKDAATHFFDVENFAFTYAFSEATQTNFNLVENTKRSINQL